MSFADDIQKRLYQLSLAIRRFCGTLPQTDAARELAGQVRRSSSSAAANYRASRRGRSRKEWLAKLGTVVEELDETAHWLETIEDSGLKDPPQQLITQCKELRAILAKSCKTARTKGPTTD
jgi:four helix bundle protein